jgi:hypothetical protein
VPYADRKDDRVINFDLYPRRGPLAWLMRDIEKEIIFKRAMWPT